MELQVQFGLGMITNPLSLMSQEVVRLHLPFLSSRSFLLIERILIAKRQWVF